MGLFDGPDALFESDKWIKSQRAILLAKATGALVLGETVANPDPFSAEQEEIAAARRQALDYLWMCWTASRLEGTTIRVISGPKGDIFTYILTTAPTGSDTSYSFTLHANVQPVIAGDGSQLRLAGATVIDRRANQPELHFIPDASDNMSTAVTHQYADDAAVASAIPIATRLSLYYLAVAIAEVEGAALRQGQLAANTLAGQWANGLLASLGQPGTTGSE